MAWPGLGWAGLSSALLPVSIGFAGSNVDDGQRAKGMKKSDVGIERAAAGEANMDYFWRGFSPRGWRVRDKPKLEKRGAKSVFFVNFLIFRKLRSTPSRKCRSGPLLVGACSAGRML